MKKILNLLILLTIFVSLFFINEITTLTSELFSSFIFKIFPSLFAILILNNIFIFSGGASNLVYNIRASKKTKHYLSLSINVIIGVLSGTPTLAIFLKNKVNKEINEKEAQAILENFASPSLPFLVALARQSNWNPLFSYLIIFLPLIIGIILFVCFCKKNSSDLFCITENKQDNIIANSILTSTKTLILMFGSIVIFSLCIIPLRLIFQGNILYIVQGLIEFSYPLNFFFQQNTVLAMFYSLLIISLVSCSLLLQIKLLFPKLKLNNLIKKRLIIAAISEFIFFGIYFLSLQ